MAVVVVQAENRAELIQICRFKQRPPLDMSSAADVGAADLWTDEVAVLFGR